MYKYWTRKWTKMKKLSFYVELREPKYVDLIDWVTDTIGNLTSLFSFNIVSLIFGVSPRCILKNSHRGLVLLLVDDHVETGLGPDWKVFTLVSSLPFLSNRLLTGLTSSWKGTRKCLGMLSQLSSISVWFFLFLFVVNTQFSWHSCIGQVGWRKIVHSQFW